jgi:hypothetical protein
MAVTALVVLVDAPAALLPSAPEEPYEPPPPTRLRVLLEDANAVGLGCVAAVVRADLAGEVAERLEEDVTVVPYGDRREAVELVAEQLVAYDEPVVVARGHVLPAPGGLLKLVGCAGSALLAPGVLRVARRDRVALATAAVGTAGGPGDPFDVLVRAARDAGVAVDELRVRA